MLWTWLLVYLTFHLQTAISSRIVTKSGPIEGNIRTLFNGKTVETFLSIPYASPPVGKLRFSPPQPVHPWKDTLQTKSMKPICFQMANEVIKKHSYFSSESPESEDCLYLHIWRPVNATEQKLAVLVWLLPGGFFAGSANLPLYDGSILASEHNVIVAAINNRMGLFGYLFPNNTEVPGNAGLQDQIQAIKWIHKNIGAFGGDPDRITLFGQSAGSIATGLHLSNPKVHHLFKAGIMESGSMDFPGMTATMSKALDDTLSLARKVQCPVHNSHDMLDCLREKTPEDLLKDTGGIADYLKFSFVPTRNGVEVPIDPTNTNKNVPRNKRKDLLIGHVPGEMKSFITAFFPGKELTEEFAVTENELLHMLEYAYGLRDQRLKQVLLHDYLKYDGTQNKYQMREVVGDIVTDQAVVCRQKRVSQIWKTENNNVYYFVFSHFPSKPTRSHFPAWVNVTHGDDIPFVFGLPLISRNGYTDKEEKLSRKVMTMWSNFAKTGNPNSNGEPFWPGLKQDGDFTYLDIDENLTVKTFLRERQCAFWTDLYPGLLSIQTQLDDGKSLEQ